jgi:hypothetical protein
MTLWKQKSNDKGKKEQNKEFVKKVETYSIFKPRQIFLSPPACPQNSG